MEPRFDFFDTSAGNWQERLAVTDAVMRELSQVRDPESMLQIYLERMGKLFPVSRRITMGRRGLAFPDVQITRFTIWDSELKVWDESPELPLIQGGILADLLYADQPMAIDDLDLDPQDPAYTLLANQRSLLAIPNYENGQALTLIIITREEPFAFPRERFPDLVWMSNLFGRAIQTARLTEQLREALDAQDRELQAIAKLHRTLLPRELAKIPTLDLAVYYQPCGRAGGDYYDVFPLPKNRWGIFIADVAGHGTSAAVQMAIVHALVKTFSGTSSSPGPMLEYLNRHLHRMDAEESGAFVTAFYSIYDADRATLQFASAGHEPARLYRPSERHLYHLRPPRRLPLGIDPELQYPSEKFDLLPGDRVLFMTDGVTEAQDSTGEQFGSARIDDCLIHSVGDARSLLDYLLSELDRFVDHLRLPDDRTVLALNFGVESPRGGDVRPTDDRMLRIEELESWNQLVKQEQMRRS
jgi:phosphoserine phosphatase RsbU/P